MSPPRDHGRNDDERKGALKGEKIYEYDLDITGMTDYGMTLEVGARQVWGVGAVNLATGTIHIDGYMQ